jgi:hypothetical protein
MAAHYIVAIVVARESFLSRFLKSSTEQETQQYSVDFSFTE